MNAEFTACVCSSVASSTERKCLGLLLGLLLLPTATTSLCSSTSPAADGRVAPLAFTILGLSGCCAALLTQLRCCCGLSCPCGCGSLSCCWLCRLLTAVHASAHVAGPFDPTWHFFTSPQEYARAADSRRRSLCPAVWNVPSHPTDRSATPSRFVVSFPPCCSVGSTVALLTWSLSCPLAHYRAAYGVLHRAALALSMLALRPILPVAVRCSGSRPQVLHTWC